MTASEMRAIVLGLLVACTLAICSADVGPTEDGAWETIVCRHDVYVALKTVDFTRDEQGPACRMRVAIKNGSDKDWTVSRLNLEWEFVKNLRVWEINGDHVYVLASHYPPGNLGQNDKQECRIAKGESQEFQFYVPLMNARGVRLAGRQDNEDALSLPAGDYAVDVVCTPRVRLDSEEPERHLLLVSNNKLWLRVK